jgi:hypothetical protein
MREITSVCRHPLGSFGGGTWYKPPKDNAELA